MPAYPRAVVGTSYLTGRDGRSQSKARVGLKEPVLIKVSGDSRSEIEPVIGSGTVSLNY